jgi:hypothetical protein
MTPVILFSFTRINTMRDYGRRGHRYPEYSNYAGGIEMAKWFIAGSILGGVVLYPDYINYVGGIAMAKWIIAGSVLIGGALLAVALRAPAATRPAPTESELENSAK